MIVEINLSPPLIVANVYFPSKSHSDEEHLRTLTRFEAHVSGFREETPHARWLEEAISTRKLESFGGHVGLCNGGGERSTEAKTSGAIQTLCQGLSQRLCSTFANLGPTSVLRKKMTNLLFLTFFSLACTTSLNVWQIAI